MHLNRVGRILAPLSALLLAAGAGCGSSSSGPVMSDQHGEMPADAVEAAAELPPPAEVTPELPPPEVKDVPQEVPLPEPEPELPDLQPELQPEPVPDVPDVVEATPEPQPEPVDEAEVVPEVVEEALPEPEPDIVDLFVEPEITPEVVPEIVPEVEDIASETVCTKVQDPATPPAGTILTQASFQLVAKAKPDEQFKKKNGQTVPKTNQTYVWSLASDSQRVWLGTAPNVMCLAMGPLAGMQLNYESSNAVCEQLNPNPMEQYPLTFPDWRLPEIWSVDKATGVATRRTEVEGTPEAPGISWDTLGWRASAAFGSYYFAAGPGTGVLWGMEDYGTSIAIWKDGVFLGAQKQTENNEARKFLVYGGDLYLGSQRWDNKGIILKWVGDESNLPDSLFQFEEVGVIANEAAWLEAYNGRIYVSTWGSGYIGGGEGFDIYRSPPITDCGGLTAADADSWEKVFQYKDYDPNPATNNLSGGGAMLTFRGALYFGSMHVPFQYECADPDNLLICSLEKYLNTHAISIFKLVEDPAGNVTAECLFGENKGGKYKPTLGKPGFGNPYNNYTWSMAVHDGYLYVGTMDFSFFMSDALAAYGIGGSFPGMKPYQKFGFDLMATPDGITWTPVTIDGLGNETNWGARWLVDDGQYLYLGTANPFNLNAKGGWELHKGK